MSRHPQSEFERFTDSEIRVFMLDTVSALIRSDTHQDQVLALLAKLYNKNKVARQELAPLLWDSFGSIAMLLQQVISVYPSLSSREPPTQSLSIQVCDALALLQSVAKHPETRMRFLRANIHMYLQPILNNKIMERHHDLVRTCSLGVIGALLKDDDPEAIHLLLSSQIFPCFLNCMEVGQILAKTVAVFIVYKILSNAEGMRYCCRLAERFFAIASNLQKCTEELAEPSRLAEDSSKRLLKHIIGCYYKLSIDPRAICGLESCFPTKLRDATFTRILQDDEETVRYLQLIVHNIETERESRLRRRRYSLLGTQRLGR